MTINEHEHHHHGEHHPHRKSRHKPWPLQAWMLLLLAQKPGHGYELMGKLAGEYSITDIDPGFLYRTLRFMESEGVIDSSWDTEGEGPPRRLYTLTEAGHEHLKKIAGDIEAIKNQMERFLQEYSTLRRSANPADERQSGPPVS